MAWQLVAQVDAVYHNRAATNTLFPLTAIGGDEVDAAHKISISDPSPGTGNVLYAVTRREHSGMASRKLSAIIKATYAAGTLVSSSAYQAEGATGWWTTPPDPVLVFAIGGIDGNGHIQLNWTEPADPLGINRCYHIYYRPDAIPTQDQRYRIASIPIGNSSFLDWNPLPSAVEQNYIISVEDVFGNESGTPVPYTPNEAIETSLAEAFARQARAASATWGATYLENATSFVWQPETMKWTDPVTGHECWRMNCTGPTCQSYTNNDIGISPWSADGKKFGFRSDYRVDRAYNTSQQQAEWYYLSYTCNTDGSSLRPTKGGAGHVGQVYFHWSPQVVDTYYQVGETHLSSGALADKLYRNVVATDGTITRTVACDLAGTGAVAGSPKKMISPDGRKLIIFASASHFPMTIASDGTCSFDIAGTHGYSVARDFAMYGSMRVGQTITKSHDNYLTGTGEWLWFMPSSASASYPMWWHYKVNGSAADGGPLADNSDFPVTNPEYDFGEVWPENSGGVLAGCEPIPWVQDGAYVEGKSSYWSHPGFDRWDRYVVFANAADSLPNGIGAGVWEVAAHRYVNPSFGGGAQHTSWTSFTDWILWSRGAGNTTYLDDCIYAAKFNDPSSRITVCRTYTRKWGGTTVDLDEATPVSSPDGTKAAWRSEFLNTRNKVDNFWSVVEYPKPPVSLEALSTGGLEFLPPELTSRRWPDEEAGDILYARETATYQLWRMEFTQRWALGIGARR